jgi:hypothetical protein
MQAEQAKRVTAPRAQSEVHDVLRPAGRAGFTAGGVLYLLVGSLALRIAFGDDGGQADRQGALRQIAAQPFGTALLWLLVVGIAGMALWRAAQAVLAEGEDGAGKRLASAGRAVFYAAVCWGTATFAAGSGSSGSSDSKSKDWTATVLEKPGGRWIVGAAGVALCAAGAAIAFRAVRRKFLEKLETGRMGARMRQAVTVAGAGGGAARGAVYVGAGVFVLVAAVRFDPHQAKGLDDTLRSFAHTPAGPWLLVVTALGLVLFGLFSFASARWRRF